MIKNINRSSIANLILAGFLYFSSANLIDGAMKKKSEKPNLSTLTQNTQISNEKSWDDFYFEQKLKNPEGRIEYEGGMKIKFLDDGREIKIPTWKQLNVTGPDMCSQYANRLALKLGYRLEKPADAWDLHKYNPSLSFLEDSLKMGDLITFYNPTSQFKRKNRESTHTATYLGEDNDGKKYFAEQRGSSTRISTIEDFLKKGMKPIKIIKTEKIELAQSNP